MRLVKKIFSFSIARWGFLAGICLGFLSDGRADTLFPLRASPNGRYLVDAGGNPFLMVGDAPQSLIVDLTVSEAVDFLASRRTNGFNTLWINLLLGRSGGRLDGSLVDGTRPFTGTEPNNYDFATPREAWFTYADRILSMAATNGFCVVLETIESLDYLIGMKANGSNACFRLGQYIGNRYKNYTNIIWMQGSDFRSWETTTNDDVVLAIANGVRSVDTNYPHLYTQNILPARGDSGDSLIDPRWNGIISANYCYTYYPTYDAVLTAYNRSNYVPAFFGEGRYEYETQTGVLGSRNLQRRQHYWSLTSGANGGFIYGNKSVWQFLSGWRDQTNLLSPAVIDIQHLSQLFRPRKWYDLVPDQRHRLISGGYGTYGTTANPALNDYATAAMTPDGTLGLVYSPTNHTLTVQMTNFSNTVVARWYDPTAGTYREIVGSPFPNTISTNLTTPGSNAGGDADWVLVLETQPPGTEPKIVAWNYSTNRFTVWADTTVNHSYGLEFSTNPVTGQWQPTSASVPGTGESLPLVDTNTVSSAARFYRVKAE